jgi:V/A-type H+-transporting ATPase subunit K
MRALPLIFLIAAFFMILAAILPSVLAASTNSTSTTVASSSTENKFLGAGIAFGLAAFGAGYGVGQSGAAAIAAVTEKAEVRTTALIFVVLAEAIAIYGFAIAILIISSSG